MKFTKLKDGKYNLFLLQQELEDLHSAVTLAITMAYKVHSDSPKFIKALHKMKRVIVKQQKGYRG